MPCFTDEDSYNDDNIVSKGTRVEESPAAKDDDEDGETIVTHPTARRSVQLLQCYSVKEGFSDDAHASLDARASFQQTPLDSFPSVGLALFVVVTG